MSLFDVNLVEIKIYYTFKEKNNSKVLTVLTDKQAEEMLKDENKKDKIETLTTKWSIMNWKEQNSSADQAYSKSNPMTGEKVFNHVLYRDSIIKSCLKQWDIVTTNGQTVPVTQEAIDNLPGDIVMGLYAKYEKTLDYSEEEMGN